MVSANDVPADSEDPNNSCSGLRHAGAMVLVDRGGISSNLDFPVGHMPRGTARSGGLGRLGSDVALDRRAVGVFDGS